MPKIGGDLTADSEIRFVHSAIADHDTSGATLTRRIGALDAGCANTRIFARGFDDCGE